MLKSYIKKIVDVASRGDAREESYYSALEGLLNDYKESVGKRKIHVTTLPKKTDAGNPDFRVWDGKQHIVGYIEAKAPTVEYLDQIVTTPQLKRYLKTFPNVILTNFFEFRLYREGILTDRTFIARPALLHRAKTTPPVENEEAFFSLLEKFFSFSLPKVSTAKTLATELAKRTRFLKDEVITEQLKEEEKEGKGHILGFYETFKTYLISGLSKEDFADLYAQTITYGLFAARTRSENGFNRKLAYDCIPRTIGILRDVFKFISLQDLPQEMEWIIDDISEVLAVTDVKNILQQYYHEGKGRDPVIHFYETFLSEYDPKTREKRGVYYTPEAVVSYIVRSLHILLKEHFGKSDGLADSSVTVLDPAAGTLTFIAEAAKCAVEEFTSRYGTGGKQNFIKEHIIKNFYAFELMMAPYAIGHLKMSFLLEELGYRLKDNERLKLYLTNTLEMEELAQSDLPGMASLSEESRQAGKIKKQQPILVILGNPPYSVSSSNKSEFIEKEMELYKEDVRDERNIQPLSDDYIKFIRFAHWKIDKAGKGVIGMITNNSYLSGLIHRGMRKKLMQSFDEIYILNLHGNSHLKERTPEGGKDENVFDIQQGVSIALFVKKGGKKSVKVFHRDLWGLREQKFKYLSKEDLRTTEWKELDPKEPYHFWLARDSTHERNYQKFIGITEIFGKYSSGVKTHRDDFVIGISKEELHQRIGVFTGNLPDETVAQTFKLKETVNFKIKNARKKLKTIEWREHIVPYAYRPFDVLYICYLPELIDRDRSEIMRHMLQENLGLIFMRQVALDEGYSHVFASQRIIDNRVFYSNKGIMSIAPLYLYPDTDKKDLFSETRADGVKQPNLNPNIVSKLSETYKSTPSPEDIFYYIYAVLYSNIYRTKYAEFLKIDFPRVPFTKDVKLFKKLGEYGKRLVELHLLKSKELDSPGAKYPVKGSDKVEKVRYEENHVYINADQYFDGVPQEVYEYQVGGYQVCMKWLKDRKGRELSLDDIKHYCKITTALSKTIEIQNEIDSLYPDVEKEM